MKQCSVREFDFTLFNALHCFYKVEKVLLKQNNKIRSYTIGTLCLTPSNLIFIEPTGVKETWVTIDDFIIVVTMTNTMYRYCIIILAQWNGYH